MFYLTIESRKYKTDLGSSTALSFKELTSMKVLGREAINSREKKTLFYVKFDQKLSFSERLLKLTGLKISFLDLFTKSATILT